MPFLSQPQETTQLKHQLQIAKVLIDTFDLRGKIELEPGEGELLTNLNNFISEEALSEHAPRLFEAAKRHIQSPGTVINNDHDALLTRINAIAKECGTDNFLRALIHFQRDIQSYKPTLDVSSRTPSNFSSSW